MLAQTAPCVSWQHPSKGCSSSGGTDASGFSQLLFNHPTLWLQTVAGLQFRTSTYNALSASLKQLADQLCGGRIVFLLEGG